eukprot:1140784-Pelagomonas_calceolata.AAC.1
MACRAYHGLGARPRTQCVSAFLIDSKARIALHSDDPDIRTCPQPASLARKQSFKKNPSHSRPSL